MTRSSRAAAAVLGFGALAVGALAAFSVLRARHAERRVPARGSFVTVGGARLHYVDRGSGPAIVMIHGLAGQSGNFTHSLVDLLTNDYRVLVLDRPGSGYSIRPRGASANVADQAAVVAAFIDALQLERPLIVGHSLGGAIALALALDHPEAVSGLALIAPYTHARGAIPPAFAGLAVRSAWMRTALAYTIATPIALRERDRIRGAIFAPHAPPHDFDTAGGGLLSSRPRAFIAASEDFLASGTSVRALASRYVALRVPASVLFATDDNILDHRIHALALREKNPDVHVTLVTGGHMLPITSPTFTAAWIRQRANAAPAGAAQISASPAPAASAEIAPAAPDAPHASSSDD